MALRAQILLNFGPKFLRMQKQSKLLILPALLVLCLAGSVACSGAGGKGGKNDTIYLESGVKYLYLQKGEGQMVDSASEVQSHINLIVGQDTVWNTYNPEAKFSFTAKVTSLIAGFDEVVMLCREGDRILAVIPPELGYGKEGTGGGLIPPNATLQFDIDFLAVTPAESADQNP